MDRTGQTSVTRREAIARLSVASLLALRLWPGCSSPKASQGGQRFRFIAVNDLHHAAPACDEWFAAVVRQLRTHEGVEFALLLGDLADTGRAESLAAIRDHFGGLGVPFYPLIGNHDYVNPTDRRAYEQTFPRRINYRFEHRGWQFVGLDSTQGTAWKDTRIQPPTFTWLDNALRKLDRHKPTVLFTHFPLGEGMPMVPLNASEVLRRLLDHNLQGVFSGHHHGYTLRQFKGVDVVTNRCCSRFRDNHDGTKEKGYWLVTAEKEKLTREFVEFRRPIA